MTAERKAPVMEKRKLGTSNIEVSVVGVEYLDGKKNPVVDFYR